MADYFLAPSLVRLRDEVDARYPKRDKASDGWIGDPSHAARVSDHNPCWTCSGRSRGIVRAIDIDISPDGRADADLRTEVLRAAIGDPRVWYVISNGIIYSRTYGFAPRTYTGSNPHTQHVHISLNGANGISGDPGNFNTAAWFDKTPPPRQPSIGENLDQAITLIRKALRHHRVKGHQKITEALVRDLRELKQTRAKFPKP